MPAFPYPCGGAGFCSIALRGWGAYGCSSLFYGEKGGRIFFWLSALRHAPPAPSRRARCPADKVPRGGPDKSPAPQWTRGMAPDPRLLGPVNPGCLDAPA